MQEDDVRNIFKQIVANDQIDPNNENSYLSKPIKREPVQIPTQGILEDVI